MPNILKYLNVVILFLMIQNAKAQGLIASNLNLNPGGVINDVAFDKYNNVYIVVGDFTSINGVARQNIAFINAANFTVNSSSNLNVIDAIDGPIHTVAFKDTMPLLLPFNHDYFLFIGGSFTSITIDGVTSTRNGIAKFNYHQVGPKAPMDHPYTLHYWNADLGYAQYELNPVVEDIQLWADTILIVGDFLEVKTSTSGDPRNGCASFNIYSGNTYSYPLFSHALIDPYRFNAFLKIGSQAYVSGRAGYGSSKGRLYKLDALGNRILTFSAPTARTEYYDIVNLNDTLLAVGVDLDSPDFRMSNIRIIRKSDGDEKTDHEIPFGHIYTEVATSFDFYKNYVFQTQQASGYYFDSYEIIEGEPALTPNWNGTSNNLTVTTQSGIEIIDNVLFISSNNLTTTGGYSRIGFAVYCLEPGDIQLFTEYDTTICQSDTLTYTVQQVNYADGYIWEYTGTGIDIGNTGALENLSDTLLNEDVDAWTREIRFTPAFTPGNLIVTAFSDCNFNTIGGQKLLSKPIVIPIDTNPLPHAFAGSDTSLTCTVNEISLHGHSETPDVTYSWNFVGGDIDLDTHFDQDTTIDDDAEFVLTVKDLLGCLSLDTVLVTLDTIRPNFDPVAGPFDLTCSDTIRSYFGFCNNLTDTTSFWVKLATNDTVSNPILVDLPGQYQFYTINNENGCIDSLGPPIVVYLNQPSPNIEIIGYDDLPVDSPLDTINCYFPSITLQCYSDTGSTLLNWVNADSTDPIGDIITITESGNYYILAQNIDNGCFNYTGINIAGDFAKPNVILPIVSNLNCSNDSLILNGGTIFMDTLLEWTGDDIPPSENPLTIYEPGTYRLTVTKNDNGCSEIDSITIIKDNGIDVFAGADTMICDGSLLPLTVYYVGEIDDITYLWNNGETDEISFFTGGEDEFASVEVFGADGCYGIDSVFIAIPPVPEIDFEGFQPCGEGATGSIVASPISGLAPFEYSIDDGETFQESPVLTDLDFGTYTIWVKDSLNCLYNFEAVIDENSALPTPQFLFSTYNFQMDTVIVIDVSNPPTDSVAWEFSEEIIEVGELDGSPLILLPETGSFLITMNAYYGECLISVTKEIFVSEFDSTYATHFNQNGIESIELYPNPTTGNFTLEINFYKKQRVAISIQDMIGYTYDERVFDEVDEISEIYEMDLDAVNGTYVVRVIAEFDGAYITFILSR